MIKKLLVMMMFISTFSFGQEITALRSVNFYQTNAKRKEITMELEAWKQRNLGATILDVAYIHLNVSFVTIVITYRY